jgi:hypothetical protein
VQRELALEFCLPAGPHRMEQSWPTRDAGAAKESRHLAAKVGVLPTHRRVGCEALLGSGGHIFAFVSQDLERFIEDRTLLRKDWAATNTTTFVVFDLWLRDTHPIAAQHSFGHVTAFHAAFGYPQSTRHHRKYWIAIPFSLREQSMRSSAPL